MQKLYLYCLAERVEGLSESVKGISGATVRALALGDICAVVSDLDADTVAVTRDNVLHHDGVVRSLLETTTPLPFRFGALVSQQQLESYVNSRRVALQARFENVRGCFEMSVKIIWDETPNATQSVPEPDRSLGAGAQFLMEKRKEIMGNELLADQAAALKSWLNAELRDLVKDEQTVVRPSGKLVLAVANLVERRLVDTYKQRVAEMRGKRPDLRFLVSGPWAPYTFANIDLEFESHFGVS